ncbi:hypothetical protein L249_8071 [Ophiocordyceps polyrhachis-furcata BCC 54312]|uniref:Uncharacterized protein n=1 Tax=Ophiocordyceps polyrhachis-furcata BCC 54312 TaxID=1330021 RepID=A0A367LI39_9HYPO|nr:hypothetical protein L249_8071 [Ophiocordyceps polyrhachis-furcata BCC 54312]
MEDLQMLQRMPRGERCPDCGSRRWYSQDGLRFCQRGHRIEGFLEFDVEDGQLDVRPGRAIRKEKEAQKVEQRQLRGNQGKSLYLEALQLLLRNQLLWLVNTKGHCDELESVVRDLWDLRIRGSIFLAAEDEASSHDDQDNFSSQPQSEGEQQAAWVLRTRAQRWDSELGVNWPMPRLHETIALCYLGLQLLKIPTRQAQLLVWANNGEMPYKTAVSFTATLDNGWAGAHNLFKFRDLPQEMRQRMPTSYARVLQRPLCVSITGGELSRAVMNLILSYHLNYAMTFPQLRWVPLLVQYAESLALPVESIAATKRLAGLLHARFHFPVESSRILPLDHPEIHLMALLVIATKLCFPFPNNQSSIRSYLPRFNWETWMRGMSQSLQNRDSREAFRRVTPNQVVHMNDETFDAYLAHVSARWVEDGHEGENHPLTELFALSNDEPEPSLPVNVNGTHVGSGQLSSQNSGLSCEGDEDFLSQTLEPPLELTETSTQYLAYKSVESLSEVAAAFYTAAADLLGLPLELLVRAVYSQERKVLLWQERNPETTDLG